MEKHKWNQKEINLNINLSKHSDSIIELLNYTRKESYRPLHLSGSIKQTCTVYLKRHISIAYQTA